MIDLEGPQRTPPNWIPRRSPRRPPDKLPEWAREMSQKGPEMGPKNSPETGHQEGHISLSFKGFDSSLFRVYITVMKYKKSESLRTLP